MKGSQAQSAIHSRQTGLHNIFAIREARGGQSRSDDRNGMLSPNLPLIAGTMNDDNWSAPDTAVVHGAFIPTSSALFG